MRVICSTQRTPEWYAARDGKLTASNFRTIMTGGPKSWDTLIRNLVFPQPGYSVKAMRRGVALEGRAVASYELASGNDVTPVGFILHDSYDLIGASPDGLVNDNGCIEIKCPMNPDIHDATIANGMPEDHMAQVQGVMWIAEREWCDFISYDPRHPTVPVCIWRIARDDDYIAELEMRCMRFLKRYQEQS